MYNRYIPQPDGSYRRNRMEDSQPAPRRRPAPPAPPSVPVMPETHCPEPPRPQPNTHPWAIPPRPKHPTDSVGHFLKQLLPKDFNTEDLLIILLLLLMSGDCKEDQNTALLTLVLYLFL